MTAAAQTTYASSTTATATTITGEASSSEASFATHFQAQNPGCLAQRSEKLRPQHRAGFLELCQPPVASAGALPHVGQRCHTALATTLNYPMYKAAATTLNASAPTHKSAPKEKKTSVHLALQPLPVQNARLSTPVPVDLRPQLLSHASLMLETRENIEFNLQFKLGPCERGNSAGLVFKQLKEFNSVLKPQSTEFSPVLKLQTQSSTQCQTLKCPEPEFNLEFERGLRGKGKNNKNSKARVQPSVQTGSTLGLT